MQERAKESEKTVEKATRELAGRAHGSSHIVAVLASVSGLNTKQNEFDRIEPNRIKASDEQKRVANRSE
jgi:hypothetical protein